MRSACTRCWRDANLKLATVLADVSGTDPEHLAAVVTAGIQIPRAAALEALRGTVTEYHRSGLQLHLALMEQTIAAVDERIHRAPAPLRALVDRLTTIPVVGATTAQVLLADDRDLGGTYFDRRDKQRVAARLVRRLSQLGYAVDLRPAA